MTKKIYNKLVRDNIPEIISNSGKIRRVRNLNQEEYIVKLNEKLLEECNEWIESSEPSEIADILEVIDSIMRANDITVDEVNILKENRNIQLCRDSISS